ncbi:hypothetical protein K7X08_004431 [Anisodus acutangulus]|uniref:Uncharacterized protein n=1 Tax=Anisodus acutangulus TaxID=402998 RepID=A0A9Q1MKQ0_9SOLA|nr:hypothetical protein K7X08_004431 [Anisodus acutangulus]
MLAPVVALPAPARFKSYGNVIVVRSNNCKRMVVATKAAYTRTPMDTPGAYQVIDEESGDKYIVWGGAEDDSHIPSKDVLSWSPNNNNPQTQSSTNQGFK